MARLYHLTLSTGHARWSTREEVREEAVAVCTDLLRRAMGRPPADAIPIPTPEGEACALTAARASRCLIVTVWGPRLRLPADDDDTSRPPLITMGVAGRSRCAAGLWAQLGQTGPRPPAPWAAVTLHRTLGLHSVAAGWLGDLERCLAWAWLDRHTEITRA